MKLVFCFACCLVFSLAKDATEFQKEPWTPFWDSMLNRSMESPTKDPLEAFLGGKVSASARYRFEFYSQESSPSVPITDDAYASTLRTVVGYETRPFYGLSVYGEYEGVHALGLDDYRIPTVPSRRNLKRPIILDPESNELNQAYLRYSGFNGRLTSRIGRQEILLNNGRFVSFSSFRQNHQTFDAASISSEPLPNWKLFYAYIDRMQRVIGLDATDGEIDMNSHLLSTSYSWTQRGTLTSYAYLNDNREDKLPTTARPFFNSTKTFGSRLEGPWRLDSEWSILYTLEYANQSDYAQNPHRVSVDYMQVELGASWNKIALKTGYTRLEGNSSNNVFQTPLAHPHNSWVEKFTITPSLGENHGLQVFSGSLSAPVPRFDDLTATLIYYEYWADQGGAHYGRELDSSLEYRLSSIDPRWIVGWRFGYYWADALFTDSVRTSLYTSFSF